MAMAMSEEGTGPTPPTRHSADEDDEALVTGSFAPVDICTPNGASDLLSGDAASALASQADESGAGLGTPFSIGGDVSDEDDVPGPSVRDETEGCLSHLARGGDPDGSGWGQSSYTGAGDGNESVASAGSQSKGVQGKMLNKLSDKTTKIMSDYQAYLAEIETEFPSEEMASPEDPALAMVGAARNAVRDSYHDMRSSGSEHGMMHLPPVSEDDDGGFDGYVSRGWDYSKDGTHVQGSARLSIDRIGGFGGGAGLGTLTVDEDNEFEQQMLMRGQKYTHPMAHSGKIKRSLVALFAVAAIVGVSVGIWKKSKKQDLNKLEGKMKSQSSGKGTGGDQRPSDVSPEDLALFERQQLYQNAVMTYRPIQFDRTEGWEGRTYAEAINFCTERSGYSICPGRAICPAGDDSEPLGGYRDDDPGGFMWIPILDEMNDWIQVAPRNSCVPYSNMHGIAPEWGVTGEGSEELTRQLMCCLGEDFAVPSSYEEVMDQYHPRKYDRYNGWEGKSYDQAVEFCAGSEEGGYGLCTYRALCPLGPDNDPLGGVRDGNAWVPVVDRHNEWVHVGDDNTCIAYSHEHRQGPGWGITGEGSETFTRSMVCCLQQPLDPGQEEAMLYELSSKKFRPELFDRGKGWEGKSYEEALDFCDGLEGGELELCPYDAVCPAGPKHEAIAYSDDEQWIPIVNKANEWVRVTRGNGSCLKYSTINGDYPDWGYNGNGSERFTQNVLCCSTQEAGPPPTLPLHPQDQENDQQNPPLSPEQLEVYENAANKYQPKWYDRKTGWTSQTYLGAVVFCSSTADDGSYELCPLAGICPLGPDTEPLGGYRKDPKVSWVPMLDYPNEWIHVGRENSCIRYDYEHPDPTPNWGLTGEGNERMTRHIACCLTQGEGEEVVVPTEVTMSTMATAKVVPNGPEFEPSPNPTVALTSLPTPEPTLRPTYGDDYYYMTIATSLEPIWYGRSDGWFGQTYLESLQFCASKDSRVPCPYIAYCPVGEGKQPLGQAKNGVSWAPILDAPNAWVQVGEEEMCKLYTELYKNPPAWGLSGENNEDVTRHIMCCLEEPEAPPEEVEETLILSEAEKTVFDDFKAQWYSREEGYLGGTYTDSSTFCNNIGGLELCPLSVYCPNGPVNEASAKPLFLQLEAFEGEQWAPVKTDNGEDDAYVLIGTLNNNPATTCHTYSSFHDGILPKWGVDGSEPDLKKYILCCKDPSYSSNGLIESAVDLSVGTPELPEGEDFDLESEISFSLKPEWLDDSDGWDGGSHEDAEAFCANRGRNLCPYAAYCPHGPGQSVSKGHSTDFSAEGVQWSPVFGHDNHWVMVGEKHGNSATTCFGYEDLEGGSPDWGLSSVNHKVKKHVMCCLFKT